MATEAQKRASSKYNAKHSRQMALRFYDSDSDIYEWMQENGYKGSWVKKLIRQEFERQKNL